MCLFWQACRMLSVEYQPTLVLLCCWWKLLLWRVLPHLQWLLYWCRSITTSLQQWTKLVIPCTLNLLCYSYITIINISGQIYDPPSGSLIADVEGAKNATTISCDIVNRTRDQINTEWSVTNFRGVSSFQTLSSNPEISISVAIQFLELYPLKLFETD